MSDIDGLGIPEEMLQTLLDGEEMSIAADDYLKYTAGETFLLRSQSSSKECMVKILSIASGPAAQIFTAAQSCPGKDATVAEDMLVGLAAMERPQTTIITLLRVKAVSPVV